MRDLRRRIAAVARASGPVLVLGESGVGKEVVGSAIHRLLGGPMHAINCGALGSLAESQLFGHARGAFTGADRQVMGAFERAGNGVVFLDEVGELAPEQQVKLLRVLDGSPFQPLGDDRWVSPRARAVAATNADLRQSVASGRFRADLLFRLSVHTIYVPPLRQRLEDLPELVAAIAERYELTKPLTEDAMAVLRSQPWPGNVRQLAAALQRLSARVRGDVIDAADVLSGDDEFAEGLPLRSAAFDAAALSFDAQVGAYQRALISRALSTAAGNVSAAARAMGMGRMALVRLMKKHGISA
jgi:DNA-binding NtrC family response regulator